MLCTVIVPPSGPATFGVKLTEAVQELPAPTVEQLCVTEKWVELVTELTVTGVAPEFASVIVCAGEVVSSDTPPKESAAGLAISLPATANVAETSLAASMASVQFTVPVHPPAQPVNAEPVAAAAVRVTEVPELNGAEQVEPQSIPAGAEDTVPVPVPALVTVRA